MVLGPTVAVAAALTCMKAIPERAANILGD
jgi:hypothetical protein